MLTVPNTAKGAGEIFRTDFTGDGTTPDPVPETHVGEFDRGITASNINPVIDNYNATLSGRPTPAGEVLIQGGLMTLVQLTTLGGVAPALPAAAAGSLWSVGLGVPLLWVINVGVVKREERYLERKFGGAYRDYKARVRQWI